MNQKHLVASCLETSKATNPQIKTNLYSVSKKNNFDKILDGSVNKN